MSNVRLSVKVVPGSSRSMIAGWLGDSLKVRVTQPPEKGKANKAVIALLAAALQVPEKQISIRSGHGSAAKVVEVQGLSDATVRERLAGSTG